MADISKITIGSTTYDIKDVTARNAMAKTTKYLGITTTALTDNDQALSVMISNKAVSVTSADAGSIVINGENEFIWNGSKWQLLGSAHASGALANKDSATGSVTATGSVSAPTITVTPSTGSVASVTNTGSLASWSASVDNEILSFSWTTNTLPTTSDVSVVTDILSATSSQPVFTGDSVSVTVS